MTKSGGVLLDSKSSPFASQKDYFFYTPIIFDDDMSAICGFLVKFVGE